MTTEAMLRELERLVDMHRDGEYNRINGAVWFMHEYGTALVEAVRDAERLDWLEKEYGSNLVNDDDCRWALSTSGFQPIPDDGGFKEPVSIVSFVEPDEWRTSIRDAIDQARAEGGE